MVWVYGFRVFFLILPLAAMGAVAPLPLLWLGGAGGGAMGAWHGHEQVFGFLAAALAGFLLTALPSWTGCRPVTGGALKAMAALWLAGRIGFWLDGVLPPWLVALLDLGFLPALLATALPALGRKERRPWEFCLVLAALIAGNAAFHLERLGVVAVAADRILFAAIDLFLVLVAVAAGRILPVTIRSALVEVGQPPDIRLPPGRRHLAAATLCLMAVAELAAPHSPVTGWLALAAACAQADRMTEMHHGAALRRPQVMLFYMAHLWMVVGLGGLGLAILGLPLDPLAMRHALGLGAAATTVLAVMSIVALRHTGRPFPLPRAVWVAPALVGLAAALRVGVPHLDPEAMGVWGVTVPALLWSAAFGFWLWRFAPWLTAPRVDGQPG
ncbi:hypothetical protein H261_17813 [Paramagnetospirillum caucaseum]|uniref:NnrS family protein n=1 Tax=Paramagnetospirillum caucaseum TaxID=1244869 RepID=M2ZML3_9PROT|nr:NnrS family protein [Paramagnetospirillum caucaseum]EME68532.1 hypothetical protein H261_17813 [Paramagnetospirillum caucaseum]